MQAELLEVHRDLVNDIFDCGKYAPEPIDNRAIPLWKQYVWGNVACHFHIRFGVWRGHKLCSHNLCADFQILLGMGVIPIDQLVTSEGFPYGLENFGSDKYWCEQPVFVVVGEVAEKGEKITSMVRLRRVEDCPVGRGDFLESFPSLSEPLASVLNRELNPFGPPVWNRPDDVMVGQLPKEVVKGASGVVDNIPNQDANSESPVLRDGCDPKDVIARLTVELGADLDLRRIFFDGTSYGIESVSKLIRPLNLGSASRKVDSHSSPRGIE